MKAFITLVLFSFTTIFSFSQNEVTLKLLQSSDKPLSDAEHFYLFEVTNSSSVQYKNAAIIISNVKCDNKRDESDLDNQSYKKDKISVLTNIDIEPNSVKEFYVKLNRAMNTRLNTWNCSEVSILLDGTKKNSGNNGNGFGHNKNKSSISNSIIIETLIPDPQNFK